ncbi:MAG: T9SS type A sorting domain-containing protein, partial [Bacteroidales bacterium]|nr:T9SS type A sorting domain-containing protein [Bacteroidales bacterium]
FSDCTGLTSAPSLPATTLAEECYNWMFSSCTSLTSAPTLPATTLAKWCYRGMFAGCTSLTSAPSLPATTLAEECYNWMFSGCTSLIISDKKTDDHPYEWRIPSVGDISELPDGWNEFMLSYTGGPFTSAPQANTIYYLATAPQTTSLPTLEAPAPSLIATPNPAHGSVTISGLPAGKVQVFDAAGRLVLSVQSDGSDSQTIDISGLAPGVHIVRAGSQSARLMVM